MWSSSGPWAIPSEVPVDPSAPEAQQWARDELARAIGQSGQAWGEIRMGRGAAQPAVCGIVLAGHAGGIGGKTR